MYLTALERVRDFAVLKATGTSNATLVRRARAPGRRALARSPRSSPIADRAALAPFFPFQVVIAASAYVLLAVVAVVVGLLASLAGLRRAIGVDPAIAFGGA